MGLTTRALVLIDLVDSTALIERFGDARAAALLGEHDHLARDLLAVHGGREIDRTDGFFLLFDGAVAAARYALDYHAALSGLELGARVGLHVGAVTLRENAAADVARGAKAVEVEGLAKPVAARVMALACAGQTLLSAAARDALQAAADSLGPDVRIESHGHYRLKGVEEPLEIFELGSLQHGAFAPPVDADKAYCVVRRDGLWHPRREVRHNLPAERDAFIGRHAELRALAMRLEAGERLLSVVGPGGTGKTRFVRRYGHAWLGEWPGGVYFCDLSEARSLDGICYAMALALDVPLGKGEAVAQLGHAIASRGRCLVVLDNFEQVLEHAAATVGHWLDRAGAAAFVATSRERLHLPGEEVFAIEPLALATDAVELFVARAQAQRPDFVLRDVNRAIVAELVRLLDGLPLAIELAAARVRVLSPAQIVERLKDRFHLLAGATGSAARQATLRAAIDWSWNLLAPWEQAALAQCTVFEGGFMLEGAEAVLDVSAWREAPPMMDVIQALVDKSLLRTWHAVEPSRFDIDEPYFGMYVSIQEYARDKLRSFDADAEPAAQRRHGRHFAAFGADAAIEALSRHGGGQRRHALVLELDNLVAACRRAVDRRDGDTAVGAFRAAWEVLDLRGPITLGVALGLQVLGIPGIALAPRSAVSITLGTALRRAGRWDEAVDRLEQARALSREAGDPRRELRAIYLLGVLRREQGRLGEARELTDAALQRSRELGDRRVEGLALADLGTLLNDQGRGEESLIHHEAALALLRSVGDRRAESIVLGNLGVLHREHGRMPEARAHYEQALAIHREVGDRLFEGSAILNLGNLHNVQGRLDEGRAHYETALRIIRDVGERRSEGVVLGNLGVLNNDEGRLDEAHACYEQALVIARELGNRRSEGQVLTNRGGMHAEAGRIEEARADYLQALALHRGSGDVNEGSVLGDLAGLLIREGRCAEAKPTVEEAVALLRRVDNPFDLSKTLCIQAQAEAGLGDLERARALLDEADALAASIGASGDSTLVRELANVRRTLA